MRGVNLTLRKKSLLAAVLALCLALLCACGAPASSSAASRPAEELPVLNIGVTTFAPYFYVDESGSYAGVDYEIALEACARMGYTPNFVLMDWSTRDETLASGRIDCIWNCFIMDGREESYQWAGPYLNSCIAVVVPADSDVKMLSDLAGKTVALRANSKIEDFFLTSEHAPVLQSLNTFSSMRSAFTAFGKGYADAVVEHQAALKQLTSGAPGLYRYLSEPVFIARAGVGFSLDADTAVVQKLDDALAGMKADGSISAIARKYALDERDYQNLEKEDETHG